MGRAVEVMLDELPDAIGLGATQRKLLHLAERHGRWSPARRRWDGESVHDLPDEERRSMRLIQRTLQRDERVPLQYFEVGGALCDLASAPVAALAGVTERRFALGLHDDRDRHRRFRESLVSLTALGHRLIAGSDDWSRHNPVHRWWGGTRLTNRTLWRWDAEGRRLSPPSP